MGSSRWCGANIYDGMFALGRATRNTWVQQLATVILEATPDESTDRYACRVCPGEPATTRRYPENCVSRNGSY